MEAVQEGGLGKLLQFPAVEVEARSCERCSSVLFGRYGAYCREFQEDINDLLIAETCAAYDPED